ncbi:MAG: CopG family transcriptional regulator [Ruminiclostridium sp.]|nr:CopG family transcriptional regulator [Ruminiclostridium sp.]
MGQKKLGRPTDNPKDIILKIRLDQGSHNRLEECSKKLNISRAEVIRRGIKMMHDDLKTE